MLKLLNITKDYSAGGMSVRALRDVTIEFRKNEFVSILGQSGCGKTTLLNIIGGLDRYTSGDLIIEGVSTKEYKDRDWDSYRNHSVGFVFQSYNLIPHQTVLSNVELALTLSGVSRAERRRRAEEALKKVGLGDQLGKKPNEMSGGQMQRVAIARALVNNPEIVLADEPTGALDSETSEQIMALLKEVAADRLVIMVTHNPDLAERYSTRIVRLLDGEIIGDTDPFDGGAAGTPADGEEVGEAGTETKEASSLAPETPAKTEEAAPSGASDNGGRKRAEKMRGKTSMSFLTALSLSLNNLMTKKGRTFMTSFAGSIGIIGIALILSLSSGFHAYIDKVQEETLSSYPIEIEAETADMSELFSLLMENDDEKTAGCEDGKIYANTDMYDMLNAYMNPKVNKNNLKKFKAWLESDESQVGQYTSAVRYSYAPATLRVYFNDDEYGALPANDYMALFDGVYAGSSQQLPQSGGAMDAIKIFEEIPQGKNGEPISDMIYSQYELLDDGMRWPENKNEIVLITDKNNEIAETFLYALGLLDRGDIKVLMNQMLSGEKDETTESEDQTEAIENWDYGEIVGKKYKLVLPTDVYIGTDTDADGTNDRWTDMSGDESYMKLLLGSSQELEIVGIIRPKESAVATAMENCAVGYTAALTDWYIEQTADSEIIKYQREHPDTDVLSGLPFSDGAGDALSESEKAAGFTEWVDTLSDAKKAEAYTLIATTPDADELEKMVSDAMKQYPDRASMEQMIISSYTSSGDMDESTVRGFVSGMTDQELYSMTEDSVTAVVTASYAENVMKGLAVMTEPQMAAALVQTVSVSDEHSLAEMYELTSDIRYSSSTLSGNLDAFGYTQKDDPSAINIYASTFENKDMIADLIEKYNRSAEKDDQITYTDYVALMMSSISTIINVISYVLIAFVSISLVVSSIMIGIITYISVLERTKEIGILRSIGASKKDISRVFNAETLIVGFVAGMLGILVTVVLNIPINLVIRSLADIPSVAYLPFVGGVILVAISMLLTFIAGLIPSRVAANKDPVVALRTE